MTTQSSVADRLKNQLRAICIYKLSGTTIIDAELEGYAEGLAMVEEAISELKQEAFIATASDYGLSLRECIFGATKDNLEIPNRRSMLLYRGAITANDNTRTSLERALIACGINASLIENFDGESIYINCLSLLDGFSSQEDVESAAETFLPAHLRIEFDSRVLNWNYIDNRSYTFNTWESQNLTWNNIDTYGNS